jgi:hypothetical protein
MYQLRQAVTRIFSFLPSVRGRENDPDNVTHGYQCVDYLNQLQQRHKWKNIQPNMMIGTVVLIKEENVSPFCHRKGENGEKIFLLDEYHRSNHHVRLDVLILCIHIYIYIIQCACPDGRLSNRAAFSRSFAGNVPRTGVENSSAWSPCHFVSCPSFPFSPTEGEKMLLWPSLNIKTRTF